MTDLERVRLVRFSLSSHQLLPTSQSKILPTSPNGSPKVELNRSFPTLETSSCLSFFSSPHFRKSSISSSSCASFPSGPDQSKSFFAVDNRRSFLPDSSAWISRCVEGIWRKDSSLIRTGERGCSAVKEGASSGGGELMVAASGGDQRGCSIA